MNHKIGADSFWGKWGVLKQKSEIKSYSPLAKAENVNLFFLSHEGFGQK